MFELLPNKKPKAVANSKNDRNIWDDYGDNCEMNLFYRSFVSAEGWVGESYIAIWTPEEIAEFPQETLEWYGRENHFFASDGGGEMFGFNFQNDQAIYLVAPSIGDKEDIIKIGTWIAFLEALKQGTYLG